LNQELENFSLDIIQVIGMKKFGFEVSPNGRFAEHEQITDIDTLSQVV
jgi:hypothetical protein